MNQSKKITDGALLTAVYIVLLLIVIFVPFIMTFGIFVLPVPFVIYAARHGWKPTILMLLTTTLLTMVFATVVSLPVTLLAGIGGIFIGTAINKKLGAYEVWARGSVGFIVGMVFVLIIVQYVVNINIYEEMDIMIQDSISMTRSIMDQIGLDANSEKQLKLIEEQMYTFKDLLPSSIAIASIFLAFVSQWISNKVINRIENKKLQFPPFKQFNLPTAVIWIYFFALILSFIDLGTDSGLYLVVLNVFALTTILITIQGLSFVFFYADFKKMHKSIPIIIVVFTLLIPQLFMFLIRIIGIMDLGFSLKARLASNKEK
ncbi:YybS family protein [Pseudogracilibacillus sp. SE30717A]|uniref:YybS family protein n=1 Tax=Pseudogracilibacillus sp. SE30717A TaxID=3098293 RepID=UPI00300E2F64